MRCLQMGADATCTTLARYALLRRAMAAVHRGPGRSPIPTTELPHANPPLERRPIRLGSRHKAGGPQRQRRPQRPTHGRGHPRERQRGTDGKGQRRQRPHCRQRKGTKRQRAPKPYHGRHADAPAHTQADRGTPRGRFQEGRALPPSRRSALRRVDTAPTTRSAPRCPSLATGLRWRRRGRDGTSGRCRPRRGWQQRRQRRPGRHIHPLAQRRRRTRTWRENDTDARKRDDADSMPGA